MVTKLQKWGNSQGLRFSKAILEEARIDLGDEVKVSVQRGRIVIEPVQQVRGKYDLKKLVARIRRRARSGEVDWGPPAGKEAW